MSDREEGQVARLEAEVRRLRSLLVQAAKLAELGQHTAGIVHEMNQPLLGVKAFAQMLKKELADHVSAHRKAAFIEEQAIVLEKLVGRLRKFSRVPSELGNASVPLAEAMATVKSILAHRIRRSGVDLEEVSAEGVQLPMDPVHAQQVLLNLVTNALDAVAGREKRWIRVTLLAADHGVSLEVADSGAGIPSDIVDRVLEPFFTTKGAEQGTGLGLPVVNEIIEAYGGRLEILTGPEALRHAGEGTGTVMRIHLPTATQRGEANVRRQEDTRRR